MNFCCIFPLLTNIELYKTVGQIPYALAKTSGYECSIVSFDNDTFTNFNEIEGLSVEVIPKKYKNRFLNQLLILNYLIKHAKDIDILNCYHFKTITLIYFLIYRFFNRKGITYFTLDMEYERSLTLTGNNKHFKYLFATKKFLFIFKYLIDFATIETKKVYDVFINFHPIFKEKLIYLPVFVNPNPSIECVKKNQIISVGRIGTHQKASEIVLKSFKQTINKINNKNWFLKMVGPISNEFEEYVEEFFTENPNLKDKIIFTGNIEDKDELYKLYSESKIFCLPSRHGSFEIVFVEALFYSNYLIITDVGTGKYLVDISDYGKIVEVDNIEDISNKLTDAIENYDSYKEKNNINFKELVTKEFGYENHGNRLNNIFQKIKNNK